ncbi:hypothetical protein ACET3Z_021561 [Daucus carota]
MASLKLFGALFIALFAVATATTYTTTVTTITTTTEDEGSSSQQGSQQQCRKEIQSKDFNMCEKFLMQGQQQGGGSLRMIVQSDQVKEGQQDMQTQCCEQLRQVKPMCRCAAIQDVLKQQMEGGQSMQSQKMKQMLQKAQNLPSQCNFDQPQECRFGQSYWIA